MDYKPTGLRTISRRACRSFTLLELMVAFIIMAILSAIAVPSLLGVVHGDQATADGATAISLVDQLYYNAVAVDQTAPINYAALIGTDNIVAEFTDSTYSTTWELGDSGTIYFQFGDPIYVSVNIGTDLATASAPYLITETTVGSSGTSGGTEGGPSGTTTTVAPTLTTPAPVVDNTTPGTLTFTWAPSTGTSGTVTYYYQLAPGTAACPETPPSSTTNLTVTCPDVTPGTSYTFGIYAQDTSDTTSVGTVTVTAVEPSVPGAPTGVTGVADTAQSSQVSWTDPADGGATITSYSVQYSSDSGATWTTATTSASDTPYNVTGLTDGTSYIFEVAATNSAGTSAWSSASAPVIPTGAPSVPSPSVTTNTNQGATGTMTFAWAASTDGHGAITYYWQLSPATTSCNTIVDTTGLTATCDDVTPGTSYTFGVYAEDALSRISSVGSVTATASQDPPGAPTGVTGVADTAHQSSVSWTAPSTNGGATITSYVVQYSSDSGSTWTTATTSAPSSPYNVTGLTDGTAYEFRVAATNSVGTGSYSDASSPVTPTGAPSTPSPSVTTNTNQGATGTMSFTWAASTDGSGTITYYWSLAPSTASCSEGSTTSRTVTCADVTPGTSYTFSVYAEDSLSRVSSTGTSTPTEALQSAPGAPSGVTTTPTSGSSPITVSWTAPSNNGGSSITGYTVTSSPGSLTCTTTGALSCTVSGLTSGTSYTFSVSATNAVGTGPSASSSAVTAGGTVTEAWTGSVQTYTVPTGVTSLSVVINGAGGGTSNGYAGPGGHGDQVTGTITVVPGTVYTILVGAGGDNGTNGTGGGCLTQEGGGGWSAVFQGTTLIALAGGGGQSGLGVSGGGSSGGNAGAPTASAGTNGTPSGGQGLGGGGGTQSAGGVGGAYTESGKSGTNGSGSPTNTGSGGNGGNQTGTSGGGGGGGYFGGGAGGETATAGGNGGGGGGSSYIGSSFTSHPGLGGAPGGWPSTAAGNGSIVITYS